MSESEENEGKAEHKDKPSTLLYSPTSKSAATATDTDSDSHSEEEKQQGGAVDMIRRFFSQTFSLTSETDCDIIDKVIPELTFEGLSTHWRQHGFKNIVTMVGAGVSTSAGIPDYRSPGSGLYNHVKQQKQPHPTAIFDVDNFKKNPGSFFKLAKELYPGSFLPTPAHYFVRLLHEKGILQRHYTQNIDMLERLAGVPEEKIVEAIGSFYKSHCLNCKHEYDMKWMRKLIFGGKMPLCERCKGLVKPDVVLFGENLPDIFYSSPEEDFRNCDLLIIMGTSLEMQPFASLIHRAGPRCIRLLINRDAVGRASFAPWVDPSAEALLYGESRNTRDVAFLGECDAGVWALVEALGWEEELQQLITKGHRELEEKQDELNTVDSETQTVAIDIARN